MGSYFLGFYIYDEQVIKMNKKQYILKLGLWIIPFQVIGFLMGQMTKPNIATWYVTLYKSSLTPPNITFGIVWAVLYVFLAYIGFVIFQLSQEKLKKCQVPYALQMILNWIWTPFFFSMHQIGAGLIILSFMVIINAYLTYIFWKKRTVLFFMSLTYQAWISFAWYLNLYISLYN